MTGASFVTSKVLDEERKPHNNKAMKAYTLHQLYLDATSLLRTKATELNLSVREFVRSTRDVATSKRYRCGAPGAFGPVAPAPAKCARSDRKGYNAPGNSHDRRFARRHPQHFSPVMQ